MSIKEKVHSLLEDLSSQRRLDNLSIILGNETSLDLFWLDCLFDKKQSSAIFKEIAFDWAFDQKEVFKSLDLWSWTWILSLASYIAWKRKKCKKWEIYFVARSKKSVNLSIEILKKLSWDFTFSWLVWDIIHESTYKELPMTELSYLISETIWTLTPPFWLDVDNGELFLNSDVPEFLLEMISYWDPFPYIMSLITKISPDLYQNIKKWKVWMFPNFPRKLFIPNNSQSTIELKTSPSNNPIKLYNVWLEFDHFEDLDLNQYRWKKWIYDWFMEIT